MLSFGYISDRVGRRAGAVLTTSILVVGIALSAGASGVTQKGMFWMLIVARGIAGVGAGGLVDAPFLLFLGIRRLTLSQISTYKRLISNHTI